MGENGNGAMPAIKSINQHTKKSTLDWAYNMLVQPDSGAGSGKGGASHEQFGMSLDLIRQALVEVSNVVNNLTTDEPGKVADARQLKVLKGLVDGAVSGIFWQEQVIDILKAPPASGLSNGDRYLVDVGATGDFTGEDGKIAVYASSGGVWSFLEPQERWGIFVKETYGLYVYSSGDWYYVGDFSEIADILVQTRQARDDVLLDTGFIAVAGDLTGSNNIGTVAGSIGNVNTVGGNISNVNKVGAIDSKVTTVANNNANVTKVANIDGNVTKVAGIDTDVTKVAGIKDDVTNVASIKADVTNVAGIKNAVSNVSGISANVTAVDNNKTNINAVNANKTNIDAVAGNKTNIDAVKNNATNINTVAGAKTNIDKVATDINNVNNVGGNIGNVNAVAGNKTNIDKVAGKETEVTALGGITDEMVALYNQLPTIAQKENVENKITAWGASPTDDQYPSAKLVYTSIGLLYPSSWAELADMVKSGDGPKYFEEGKEFRTNFKFNDGWKPVLVHVLGLDQDKLAGDSSAPTMTIGMKDILFRMAFDASETGNPDSDRSSNGNNNYGLSNIRQWLNSETDPFVYASQHTYDKPPDNTYPDSLAIYNGAGFMARLDPELASVIAPVKKWTSKNQHAGTDGTGDYETTDKAFLLSYKEVGFGNEGTHENEFVYQYYNGASNADRIKLLDNTATIWWLRSPYLSYSHYVRSVRTTGTASLNSARSYYGIAPAFVIG